MVKTAEGLSQNPVYGEAKTNRRNFLKAAAGLGVLGVGVGGGYILGGRSEGGAPESNAAIAGDVEPTSQPDTDTSEVAAVVVEPTVEENASAILVRNPNLYAGREKQDPSNFIDMSPMELESEFSLSSNVIDREDYPEAFVFQLGAAINLGCNDIDVKEYIEKYNDPTYQGNAKAEYLMAMDEKYTFPVFKGLFTHMSREEAEGNPTYRLFRGARHGVLEHFFEHALRTGNVNEVAAVDMVDHGELDERGDNFFAVEIDVRVSNDIGNNDPTVEVYSPISGKISVDVNTDKIKGRYSTILVAHDGHEQWFNDLAKL